MSGSQTVVGFVTDQQRIVGDRTANETSRRDHRHTESGVGVSRDEACIGCDTAGLVVGKRIVVVIHPRIRAILIHTCVDHSDFRTIVDCSGTLGSLDAVIGARTTCGRQVDDLVGRKDVGGEAMQHSRMLWIRVRFGHSVKHDVKHRLTSLVVTPYTEEVVGSKTLVRRMVLVRKLHTAMLHGTTIDVEGVEFIAAIAHETTVIVVVVDKLGDDVAFIRTLLGSGVGKGVVGTIGHQVEPASQRTVGRRGQLTTARGHRHGDVTTAVDTDLVVMVGRRKFGVIHLIVGRCCGIQVVAHITEEVTDVLDRFVDEQGASVDHTDILEDVVDGVLLSGLEDVYQALSRQVDVRVLNDEAVGILDGLERTGGAEELLMIVSFTRIAEDRIRIVIAKVTDHDTLEAWSCGIVQGTAAIHSTADGHVLAGSRVGILCFITVTVDVDLGTTRNSRITEGVAAFEGTEVGAGIHVVADHQLLTRSIEFSIVRSLTSVGTVRGVLDGVGTDEYVIGAEGVAVVAGAKHILLSRTAAEVDHANGFVAVVGSERRRSECKGVVGLEAAAIQVVLHRTTAHVHRTLA